MKPAIIGAGGFVGSAMRILFK
ncbi:hypothetical protein LCGC14_2814820, partial [marine sediment metagenome]